MPILHAIDAWLPYLLGLHFQIHTDHHSLRYFLDQHLSSPQQNKWLTKMLGCDYEIIYKKGHDNVVVDALSCQFEEEGTLLSLSLPILDWIEATHHEWFSHPSLSQLIHILRAYPNSWKDYSWKDEILHYKDWVVLSATSTLKLRLLEEFHSSRVAGHLVFHKTYAWPCCSFFCTGMKHVILTFVAKCKVCQCNKGETIELPGTLQPFNLPAFIWTDVSMDFIIDLPKSGNKSVIMVVVHKISKYAHFCALPYPFTPTLVALVFMDQIFKLHGMLTSITSHQDPTFTITFWQERFKLHGMQLQLSTHSDPQIDGQTEAVNKCLETYLRCFTSDK